MKYFNFKKTHFSIFFLIFMFFISTSYGVILNTPQKYQEESQWCWAACSQSILEYYGTIVTQIEIVEYGTVGENIWNYLCGSGSSPTRRGINLILYNFGNIESSSCVNNALSLSTVNHEINENRPIVINWYWEGGGGHFVVAHGIEDSTLYLMDPLFGPTINSYNWVCMGSNHSWDWSLRLITTPTSIAINTSAMPENVFLYQNYPNPFNPMTNIRFYLPKSSFVTLKVYNLSGQEIETLINGYRTPGEHEVKWAPEGIPSGIYLYRLQTDDLIRTKELVFLK